jgi:hypothetical protein
MSLKYTTGRWGVNPQNRCLISSSVLGPSTLASSAHPGRGLEEPGSDGEKKIALPAKAQ